MNRNRRGHWLYAAWYIACMVAGAAIAAGLIVMAGSVLVSGGISLPIL